MILLELMSASVHTGHEWSDLGNARTRSCTVHPLRRFVLYLHWFLSHPRKERLYRNLHAAMWAGFAPAWSANLSGLRCAATTRVCRVCKKQFTVAENSPTACRFHSASWMGAENSKHYGGAPASTTTEYRSGVSYFWDCELDEDLTFLRCVVELTS